MEEKRMSPILIIVLSVLGTCLVGLGIWYGVNHFKGGEDNKPIDEQVENNKPVNDQVESMNFNGTTLNFPQYSQDWVKLLSQEDVKKLISNSDSGFKEISFIKNGKTYKSVCKKYEEGHFDCQKTSISVDGNYEIEVGDGSIGWYNLYEYNGIYFLVYSSSECDCSDIYVYKNNSLVLIQNTTNKLYDSSNTSFNVNPVVKDSKLHFINCNKNVVFESNKAAYNCSYNIIDLNDTQMKSNVIQNLKTFIKDYEEK